MAHLLHVMITAKQLAGLVYVGIALLAIGSATLETNGNVQWFSAVNNLDLHIGNVVFKLDGQGLGYPYVIVDAALHNPGNYNGLSLSGANYQVFLNSTSEAFTIGDSSQIANGVRGFQHPILGGGNLNMTVTLSVFTNTVAYIVNFTSSHSNDLVKFVGVTLYFDSIYGGFSVPYCYELPANVVAYCPSGRAFSPPPGTPRGG